MTHVLPFFLHMQSMVKMYHWYTSSFAQHSAFDQLSASLGALTDKFIEVHIGKYGRPKLSKRDLGLQLELPSQETASGFCDACIAFLTDLKLSAVKDADLINIRDEIVAELNKTKYLLTLS